VIEALAGHDRGLDPHGRAALRTLPVAVRGGLPSYRTATGERICPILAQAGSLRVRSLVAARFDAATGVISKEPAT
jgi:tRNA(Ile)-lysidine synthase